MERVQGGYPPQQHVSKSACVHMYSCEGANIHDDDNDNAVCGPADAEGLEKSYDSESRT